MNAIIDNGEELEINTDQTMKLMAKDLIYKCADCNCYHTNGELSLDEIKKMLDN